MVGSKKVYSLLSLIAGLSFFTQHVHAQTYTSTYNGISYSSDHPYNLNVVYFVPNDVTLDSTYQTRLSALLLYGQDFYKQNMINNGYGPKTFGLLTQTANPDQVKIILIHGQESIGSYPSSGGADKIMSETNAFFANNPSQKTSEHTLYIMAVIDQAKGDIPFYGLGRNCFAIDYPQLDLQYKGASGNWGDLFTKWFGGMMHELGHGLNLPHSHQTNTENNDPDKGMNLMFGGNWTLGISPTFINRAGCAILNNCQVFADAPGVTYYNGHKSGLTKLHAEYDNGDLVVSGKFYSDKTITDINIYQDPYSAPSQGYYKVAWSVSPLASTFSLRMPVSELETKTGPYNLQVELVLANGETTFNYYPFSYDNSIPAINIDFDDNAVCDALPAGWQFTNVGTGATPGVVCYTDSTRNYWIKCYGSGVSDPNDDLPFVYTMLSGDCRIIARVKDVSSEWNNFGGLMMRNTLAGNSNFISVNALDTRGVFHTYRIVTGGNTGYQLVSALALPMWLKLERVGNVITSYYSADSVNWSAYHSSTVSFNSTVYVGLVASGSGATTDIDMVSVSSSLCSCNTR